MGALLTTARRRASLARSAASARWRSVMSRATTAAPTTSPDAALTGAMLACLRHLSRGLLAGQQDDPVRLGPLALRDVARIGDNAPQGRVMEPVRADPLQRPPGPIGVPHPELRRFHRPRALHERGEGGLRVRQVIRVHELEDVAALHLRGPIAEDAPVRGAGVTVGTI